MLSNTLRLNFSYLKNFHILHPRYHPKIIRHILNDTQKSKRVFIHDITRLITMKMKMKVKNGSHRHDIYIDLGLDMDTNIPKINMEQPPEVFCKKRCSKVAQACNFIKKETLAQVFSCEYCEIPKNTFFYRTPLDGCLSETNKELQR